MSPTRFRLAEELEKQGMSQSELARRAGVAFTTVSKMCRNVSAQASLATLDAIANVLSVEPGSLIEREEKRRKR